MTQRFGAFVLTKDDQGQSLAWTDIGEADLMEGDVTVAVSHSTINYKDGLALTGKAPVVRRWPMIPGIDLSGTVTASSHAGFKPGDHGDHESGGFTRASLGDAEHIATGDGDRDCLCLDGGRCGVSSRDHCG